MKIKNWIYISYIFVILIPSILIFFLYRTLINYNSDLDVFSYLKITSEMNKYEKYVDKPDLYSSQTLNTKLFDRLRNKNVYVSLYSKYGALLYASNKYDKTLILPEHQIYKGLYELNIGYSGCSYKKPVFIKGNVAGFYEITIVNRKLVQGINNNSILIYCIFGFVLILVFLIISVLVNKRINRPVKILIESIRAFGDNSENIPIVYNKKDELAELISQFENMKKEIIGSRENKLKEQKEKEYMIAAMSHDLKSPLTSIRAYAESIQKSSDLSLEDKLTYTDVIINKSDYMNRLIEDLLSYTLLSGPEYKLNFVKVDGEEFFATLFSGYEKTCQRNNTELMYEFNVHGNYLVDIKHMVRLFDNLIMNSIRYVGEDRNIMASAVSDDVDLPPWIDKSSKDELESFRKNGVIIIVKNNGKPIPLSEKERIFKPFYRWGDTNNMTAYNGVGLGLSIVKMILDKHQGKVKVFSNEYIGTIFACWIKRV